MKQMLIASINQFIQAIKEPMGRCGDGALIKIMENGLGVTEMSVSLPTSYDNDVETIREAMEIFSHGYSVMLSACDKITVFEVIIKKEGGKLLAKNTLSPKEIVKPQTEVRQILEKYDMKMLINLIQSDPKWLSEILHERAAQTNNEDFTKACELLNKL